MSSPLVISSLIETAVGNMPNLLFLRATDEEANIVLDDIDLSANNVAIYNNRPDTVGTAGDLSGNVEVEWPIEIQVIGLADFDDNDADADTIADPLYTIAEELFDRISQAVGQSGVTFPTGYEIGLGESVKLYDKTLTGVMLSFSLFYSRGIKCF